MKSCGETITELMIVEKIMHSLPRKFDYIAVAIEESHDLAAMKVEELQSSLEAHEMRLVNRSPIKNSEQALKAHHLKYDEERNKADGKENEHKIRRRIVEMSTILINPMPLRKKVDHGNATRRKGMIKEILNASIATRKDIMPMSVMLTDENKKNIKIRKCMWCKKNLIQIH